MTADRPAIAVNRAGSKAARRDAEFAAFVAAHRPGLQRLAHLLSSDWHAAEDLVQTALLKLYQAWPRLSGATAMEAYTRQILVHTHIDQRRRSRRRPETPAAHLPERPAAPDSTWDTPQVLAGLRTLPDRQRAVVVLRYLLDISVAETARLLACSTGNVKSQAARGLARLRLQVELDRALVPDHMGIARECDRVEAVAVDRDQRSPSRTHGRAVVPPTAGREHHDDAFHRSPPAPPKPTCEATPVDHPGTA